MAYEFETLTAAHQHCTNNRSEVEASGVCGCFYCSKTFPPDHIDRWLIEGSGTAICPECQVDSVIGSASGYPVSDPEFLLAMHGRWFA
jgi:hypothetical protein